MIGPVSQYDRLLPRRGEHDIGGFRIEQEVELRGVAAVIVSVRNDTGGEQFAA